MSNCCLTWVPPDSGYQAFGPPVQNWQACLRAGLDRSLQGSDHTLDHLEEEIAHQTRALEYALAQEAAQKKADQSPLTCLSHSHVRTAQTRFGSIQLRRTRRWCQMCRAWHFPFDYSLGIDMGGTVSPAVQEMTALLASKMPLSEASAKMTELKFNAPSWTSRCQRQPELHVFQATHPLQRLFCEEIVFATAFSTSLSFGYKCVRPGRESAGRLTALPVWPRLPQAPPVRPSA